MTTTSLPTVSRNRRKFSVADYYAMAEAGILAPQERVELLNGEVIEMAPIGEPHAFSVDWITEQLFLSLGQRAIVRIQNPLLLNDRSMPQPDLLLLERRDDFYRHRHPSPGDVLLLIEVSDTTVAFDRTEKLALYAAAGIPETWIVNIPGHRIESYTEPENGQYGTVRCFGIGESISPQAFPDITIDIEPIMQG